MDREMHIETIEKVQKYIYEKNFEGLKIYIDLREKQVKGMAEDNKSSDYMDELVGNLQ